MEYLIIALILIFGIVRYDFQRKADNSDLLYKVVFALMVLMSGLAYRVGADLVNYEETFYTDFKTVRIADILSFTRSQPGWKLLSAIVYKTAANFTVFKLIQAAFFQFAVFYTIKKYTAYRYTALLLFFVFLFPHANFNVLRESFAIGFFLLSLPYLIEKKWVKYYLCVFGAYMFHSGAMLLILFPLVMLVDFCTAKKVFIVSAVTFVVAIIMASLDLTSIIMGWVMMSDSEDLKSQAEYYILRDRYEITGFSNIAKSLLFFVINVVPLFYVAKYSKGHSSRLISTAFLYVLVTVVYNFIPIMYRYQGYTYVLYFLIVSTFLVECSKKTLKNNLLLIVLLFGVYFYSARSYFAINEIYQAPSWVQYYPYHSIIDKGTSPIREQLFY